MARVVIGVDPHKRLNAVVVVNVTGEVAARRQFANSADGFRELRVFRVSGAQERGRLRVVTGSANTSRNVLSARVNT